MTITINEYVDPTGALAYWNAGYAGVNAELLLHELAHAYTLLRGSGGFNGTRFISDSKLDTLIQNDCFPGGLQLKIVIVSALLFGNLAAAPPRIYSVCEAANAGDGLDGKTVRISGVWRQSNPALKLFDELVDIKCPEAEIHVVATVASLPHPPPVGYKLDTKSTRIAQHVAEKALADGRDLSATIVGVLYVQKKEDYVQPQSLNKDVKTPPHHKWYPLVLLIESVPAIRER